MDIRAFVIVYIPSAIYMNEQVPDEVFHCQ